MSSVTAAAIDVLELGAGENPHPDATVTLDIRDDLAHIDLPGVDVGADRWPVDDESVRSVRAYHVLEHIPPEHVGHLWRELDRVLVPGGRALIETPHAGTLTARTDSTHYGTGGTTPAIAEYFGDGYLESYWPELDWTVRAYAIVDWPTILRPSRRLRTTVSSAPVSHELVKLPFVDAAVRIEIQKRRR